MEVLQSPSSSSLTSGEWLPPRQLKSTMTGHLGSKQRELDPPCRSCKEGCSQATHTRAVVNIPQKTRKLSLFARCHCCHIKHDGLQRLPSPVGQSSCVPPHLFHMLARMSEQTAGASILRTRGGDAARHR